MTKQLAKEHDKYLNRSVKVVLSRTLSLLLYILIDTLCELLDLYQNLLCQLARDGYLINLMPYEATRTDERRSKSTQTPKSAGISEGWG